MPVLGVTGGIGSGKSVVCRIFAQLGIPVYNSDTEAKKILNSPEVRERLTQLFSSSILDSEGNINRKKISELVFNDKDKLALLNSVIHPPVIAGFEEWKKKQTAPYIIKEAAILFESGTFKGCDKIITVVAPQDLRIKRIQSRDNLSEEEIIGRMNNQWSDEEKIKRSDFVIYNDERQLVIPQVLKIHGELKK